MANEQLEPRVHKKTESAQMSLGRLSYESMVAEHSDRRRIALDIHNQIVRDLVFCNLRLGYSLKSDSATELSGALEEVQCLVQLIIEKVRTILAEISPPLLYDLGLRAAIEELLKETNRKHGIMCYLEEEGTTEIGNQATRLFLYESIYELIANVIKHARAENIIVHIGRSENGFIIRVEDDGTGFDPRTMDNRVPPRGIGLVSLRERLNYLGGRMDIQTEAGTGTCVAMIVPLDKIRPMATV